MWLSTCLIGDRDGVYDPGSANGRLLLGLKGAISEVELHTLRGRLGRPAEQGRARRAGAAATGGLGARWRRSGGEGPDREVQERIGLVFASFLELGRWAKCFAPSGRTLTCRGATGSARCPGGARQPTA